MTFKKAAYPVHALKQAEWKNGKHQNKWIKTLVRYVSPMIGNMLVGDIESQHLTAYFNPI